MKKRFTHLISYCFAFLLLGSGTIWGQTFWGNGCNCSNGNLGIHSATCNAKVIIDGYQHWQWGNSYGNIWNTYPRTAPSDGCYSTKPGNITTYWINSSGRIVQTVWASSLGGSCGGCSSGTSCYTWTGTDTNTANYVGYPCGGTTQPTGHSHDHIRVNLEPVESQLEYASPTWRHTYYTWSFSTITGVWAWSATGHATDGNGKVQTGTMYVGASGLRLTGAADQINKTSDNTYTANLNFDNAQKLYFDQTWNGSFNNVVPTWNPVAGVTTGQAIGFLADYTGSTAIPVTGGTVALGPDASCNLSRKMTIASSASRVYVNAYNIETNYCGGGTPALPAADVGYRVNANAVSSTSVEGSQIHITNTNYACYAVNFCDGVFTPLFTSSTNAGSLLIDPNVTNFNGGVNIVNTTSTAPTDINSKKITVASGKNFNYEGTTAPLSIFLTHQGTDCNTPTACSFFIVVNGTFTTKNNATSTVSITDVSGDDGYVQIGGDYTHTSTVTNTDKGSHSVNVLGKIDVDGTTLLTAVNDPVSFTSRSSWIQFGATSANTFTFTGTNSGTGIGLLNILANGSCTNTGCADNGGFVLFTGNVSTTNETTGTVSIKSAKHYVQMNQKFEHTGVDGSMLTSGHTSVNVADLVDIKRNGIGNDSVFSAAGHVDVTKTFTYNQTISDMTKGSGLSILAEGGDCAVDCNNLYVDGYVHIGDLLKTTNTGFGYTKVISKNDYVQLNNGLTHVGKANELLVSGQTRVDIYGDPVSITMDSIGKHNGVTHGNATIISNGGHVYVANKLTYDQSAANDMADAAASTPSTFGGFFVTAKGACNAVECIGGVSNFRVGGFAWFNNDVDIKNAQDGKTNIFSENHYVQVDGKFDYVGEATSANTITPTLLVAGKTGIDMQDEVTVTMDSTGQALFNSSAGHIHFQDKFTYTQDARSLNSNILGQSDSYGENGLSFLAQGAGCSNVDCNGRPGLGYIWFEKDLTTTNQEHGSTSIKAEHHYILMDGKFTHQGVEGNLDIIAGTSTADPNCDVNCDNAETTLPAYNYGAGSYMASGFTLTDLYTYTPGTPTTPWTDQVSLLNLYTTHTKTLPYTGTVNFSHAGRGYVRIADAVQVTMDSIGKARIQSMSDVVQFDKTLKYTGIEGSDLLVDGYLGIRTLGNTDSENTEYLDILESDWSNKFGGNTRYKSVAGFIDFHGTYRHDAHQANEVGKAATSNPAAWRNSYTFANDPITENLGAGTGSSLDMDAHKRIRFWQDATIFMDSTYGHAKFYAHKGFVDYVSTFNFNGTTTAGNHNGVNPDAGSLSTPGDLLILGYGVKNDGRSHFDTLPLCAPTFAGVVLFQDDANISFADTGRTLIRSQNDDVMMYTNFIYTDNLTAGVKNENGQFWMQAGQDILGAGYNTSTGDSIPAFGKSIAFTQAGEKSLVMEAQGTIHTQQYLAFDRTDAKAGSILLKAGYNYVVEPFNTNAQDPKSLGNWTGAWAKNSANSWCAPHTYTERMGGSGVTNGGDIWFEGSVNIDLSQTLAANADDSVINTMIGALHSVYIDSSFVYDQAQMNSPNFVTGYLNVFAHEGNIEAIKDGQTPAPISVSPSGTSVDITVDQPYNTSEIRFQAGNDPLNGDLCNVMNCYLGTNPEWTGNILFNKPLNVTSNAKGYTVLSAERDIETQVDAPFTFTYTNETDSLDDLYMTAGRHIETHKKMTYTYTTDKKTKANVTMQAGRLDPAAALHTNACTDALCKVIEEGSNLYPNGSVFEPHGTFGNDFSKGGKGQGSILLFDSVEFTYDGKGMILMTALNGNIESDPYLHKADAARGNTDGRGYHGGDNIHDAQITINHNGGGKTKLEAIDIKLHDKIAYYALTHAVDSNGQFYMVAFDSILTRNVEYINRMDTGSVFITTNKYKAGTDCDDHEYYSANGGLGINQGHIVLGYGADCGYPADDMLNHNDSIIFNYEGNNSTKGANVIIRAGYAGFENNKITGKVNKNLFANHPNDKGKGYGGNITFDFMKVNMAQGDHKNGGYMEISTPNGNIWGKDSVNYDAHDGDLLVDAGLGSVEDTLRATRWSDFNGSALGNGHENTLNTKVPFTCDENAEWRTGNIMMKGATLNFNDGKGNATFRTREGFIDTYDAFTATNMEGHLLKYAGAENSSVAARNQWGDVSERDFQYIPTENSGSVFFGADDNIMLNYGYSNDNETEYDGRGAYDFVSAGLTLSHAGGDNPFYYTPYEGYLDICASKFNVNKNGYLWYHHLLDWAYTSTGGNLHRLYRGCSDATGSVCSPNTGDCKTIDNKARDLVLHFDFDNNGTGSPVTSGGFASVATNFIDVFTKFEYHGGQGTGLHQVPGMSSLHGESVQGYGLFMKSQFNGTSPEKRRATCEGCDETSHFPIQGRTSARTYEWTYIGFHDDARIHTHNQKSLIEAPVVEFFGHAQLDAFTGRGSKTKLTVKADSLIFHDSAVFQGGGVELIPYTTGTQRKNDMRYGVINDDGPTSQYYKFYGPAIEMPDREMPVIELGYQRCTEPRKDAHGAPNLRSLAGKEDEPHVGGDIIVAFKQDFSLPILNTVVANHARISFISDSIDGKGGEYLDAFIRADLLRIRNKVEFYTDPSQSTYRRGVLKMTSLDQMASVIEAGMYPRHLHMEPNSELSIPGQDSLAIIATTTIGGYGNIHENIFVKANGILAPGFASLMEHDCQTPGTQGKLTIHNLKMEKDAVFRISISSNNCEYDLHGNQINCTQTDTLVVQDSIFFFDKIPLVVLPETEYLDEGCYLFLEYGDSLGISKEYVKNFVLKEDRYGDYYFGLDYSTPGKVYLCVMSFNQPVVQRYVDLPSVEGVMTTPNAGRHYVKGNKDFVFSAFYTGTPLKVRAVGQTSGEERDLDNTAFIRDNGSYVYTIQSVVQPWKVYIGPNPSTVSNEDIDGRRIWTYKNTLYINVEVEDIVSVYNMTGVLYKKLEISAGLNKFQLDRGAYVVTLKDGSVHKVIIK